ncbi:hypothetical protein [Mesorhizobium sp. A623]
MPSITARHKLRIFASASTGPTICLALKDFEAGDADSIVLIHTPRSPQAWQRIEVPFDVMDLARLPQPNDDGAEYIALASTGEAIVLASQLKTERINPEGTFRFIEPGKGMLSAFSELGINLLALGRGGQVYQRGDAADWQVMSDTYPLEDDPTDHINFLCAAALSKEGALFFGGSAQPQTKSLDDITQSLLRGDIEGFSRQIMTDVRPIYGTLWRLKAGQWSKVDIPFSGTVTGLKTILEQRVLLATNFGLVGEIIDVDQFENIYAHTDQKNISMLTVWDDRTIVLLDDEIVALDLIAGTDEAIPVPPGFEALQQLQAEGDDVWLVDWRGLARWSGSGWEEVEIPRALLR